MEEPEFTVTVDQNPFLARDATRVEAIIGVEAAGGPAVRDAGPPSAAAEVIIIDVSSSMAGEKLVAAKHAAKTALDALREGTLFALIAGNHLAENVYPRSGGLARLTPATRAEAKEAVGELMISGGTDFTPWLLLADRLLAGRPEAIRHAILLTDGQGPLAETALESCKGHFTCDARGVGGGWDRHKLAWIASTLLGTWDLIREPQDMAADFQSMIAASMSKRVAEVHLRVRPANGVTLRRFQQVAPTIEDLTARGLPAADGRSLDFPLGAWGEESRDYQIGLDADRDAMGMEVGNPTPARAALISIVMRDPATAGGARDKAGDPARASVRVGWTDDLALSTRIDPRVADYTGQVELSHSVEAGLTALESGDHATASVHFADALRRARSAGRTDTVAQLDRIVEVDDERAGTVRIRKGIDNRDIIGVGKQGTITVKAGNR
jgi:hypothetical protein